MSSTDVKPNFDIFRALWISAYRHTQRPEPDDADIKLAHTLLAGMTTDEFEQALIHHLRSEAYPPKAAHLWHIVRGPVSLSAEQVYAQAIHQSTALGLYVRARIGFELPILSHHEGLQQVRMFLPELERFRHRVQHGNLIADDLLFFYRRNLSPTEPLADDVPGVRQPYIPTLQAAIERHANLMIQQQHRTSGEDEPTG